MSGADRSLGGLSKEWQGSLRRRGYLTQAEVAEIQRGRIIAATVEAAAEVGYQGLSVAAIISRARLSRKTFYESFSDREDCFLATFERALGPCPWVWARRTRRRRAGAPVSDPRCVDCSP